MRTIDINLQPSPLFLSLLGAVVVGSICIIFMLPIAILAKILLLFLLLPYSFNIIWQHGLLKSSRSISQLSYNATGWQINQQKGMVLCGDSTVTTLVCILRFKAAHAKTIYSVIICKDALLNDQYRHLLVQLRTSHAQRAEQQRRIVPTA